MAKTPKRERLSALRKKSLMIRLSVEEHSAISNASRDMGAPMGTWARMVLVSACKPPTGV